jgi:YggT family protein
MFRELPQGPGLPASVTPGKPSLWRQAPWDEVHRMRAILDVVLLILNLYTWVIIASAVLSWLLAFNVVNYSNSVVRSIWTTIQAVTEPLLQPIRNRLPRMGAIDLAPIILLIGIFFLERVIIYYVYPSVGRF